MIDFSDILYLQKGNQRQQAAFKAIANLGILEHLKTFTPILVGTIPINIDIKGSDLDIICHVSDQKAFQDLLIRYLNFQDFSSRVVLIDQVPTVIANFHTEGFDFEIFGQNIPVLQQKAYRHMLIEYLILESEDEGFRRSIVALKEQGYKTEPAFATLLGLEGDPYQAILDYKK